VFELGFFIGRLGPSKVAALLKGDVEESSDFPGVAYTKLEPGWKIKFAGELRYANVPFDADKVLTA
jgi:predicted nucleotide-binding protein